MRLITTIIILCFFSNTFFAQHSYIPFAQPNKFWFYRIFNNHEPAPQSENAYALWTKDYTTIEGKEYLNVYRSYLKGTHPCQFPPCFSPSKPYIFLDTIKIGYLREDTSLRTVNFLSEFISQEECANSEHEVLNFNLNVDDTISKCFRLQLGGEDKVWGPYGAIDSIEDSFIFGKVRKVWSLTVLSIYGMPHITTTRLIEGIGMDLYNVLNFTPEHNFIDFCEGDLFQCHIASSTNITRTSEIKLFPNPTNGIFKLEGIYEVKEARFLDNSGRSNPIMVTNNEIDISSYQAGVYYLVLTDRNNHQYFNKIVKL